MAMYAFRRMRERNEAALKAASLTPTIEKPKTIHDQFFVQP